MDLPANRFKRALRAAAPPIGTWLMSAAPSTAEALGCAGFDFLVVDTEHVPLDTAQTIEILRAIAGTPASAVTRVAWNDAVLVKRALDAGAQSLMFPFVQTADEARRAVASTRYPPQGTRGVAAMHRGSRYATVPDYLQRANDEIAVIVQVETPAALDALPAIAAVDGVDSIFVGPGRPVGGDGPPRRHRARRRAGGARARGRRVPRRGRAVRHRRPATRRWSAASSTTATRGWRSAPT